MLKGKNIVLGVTGGIAVYKACDLTSKLVQQGANVKVVMTENAKQFVSPLTFQALSRNPVYDDTFDEKAWRDAEEGGLMINTLWMPLRAQTCFPFL